MKRRNWCWESLSIQPAALWKRFLREGGTKRPDLQQTLEKHLVLGQRIVERRSKWRSDTTRYFWPQCRPEEWSENVRVFDNTILNHSSSLKTSGLSCFNLASFCALRTSKNFFSAMKTGSFSLFPSSPRPIKPWSSISFFARPWNGEHDLWYFLPLKRWFDEIAQIGFKKCLKNFCLLQLN